MKCKAKVKHFPPKFKCPYEMHLNAFKDDAIFFNGYQQYNLISHVCAKLLQSCLTLCDPRL